MIRSPLAGDFILSPNTGARRNGRPVDMLILHYTGMSDAGAARKLLCDPASHVSCHYLVDVDGGITQMVGEEMRAWHAGASFWRGEADTNSRSIGIEIHNPGHGEGYADFPGAQMERVIALSLDILSRHSIPARHVLAHSDVAPGRKIDPGEKFDWQRLFAEGIGLWVPPAAEGQGEPLAAAELGHFRQLLACYGYGVETTSTAGCSIGKAADAFQRHFRQSLVDGVPDRSSLITLERLVKACGTSP